MLNKYLRLIKEPAFFLRLLIIVILVFISVLFGKKGQLQSKEIAGLHEKMLTAAQVPELEARLRVLTAKNDPKAVVVQKKPEFVLKGIFMQNGATIALINTDYYFEGASIGDFLVAKVTANKVKLTNKKTGETLILLLF
jgi:hypothetical protein